MCSLSLTDLPEEVIASYYEGDIILTPWQKEWMESTTKEEEEEEEMQGDKEQIHRRAVVKGSSEKWANGVVPYVLHSSLCKHQ